MERLHGDAEAWDLIERDDGFIVAEDPIRYLDPPHRWSALDGRAFEQVRGRVLDVGCGGGRIALALQDTGHDVVAIDASPGAIEVCRERGVRQAHVRSVTQIDGAMGPFDSIAMFGNNLGLLSNARRAVWLLRRMKRITAPGGQIVASTNDPYTTDEPADLAYQARNRARGRMPGQIRLRIRYREAATPWFDYLLLSLEEVRAIAAEAGWAVGEVLTGEGSAYAVVLNLVR